MNPRYPIFIPTKGRADTLLTIRSLEAIGVPYRAVVEEAEYDAYAAAIDPAFGSLLVLPFSGQGLVAARNWIWDLAEEEGHRRFWTMDDNIDGFFRLWRNLKTPVASGTILYVIEDFVERYENVAIAGMNYFMFAPRKTVMPPFYLNTRVYSNMLIDLDARDGDGNPYRNRGFFNDDTDLCIRVLKDGLCTVLFNAFLIQKETTMSVSGGMTPYYEEEGGRLAMAQSLVDQHPDVAAVSERWGRPQHYVDYSSFRRNRLIRRAEVVVPEGVNNFGMILEDRLDDGSWVPRAKGARREPSTIAALPVPAPEPPPPRAPTYQPKEGPDDGPPPPRFVHVDPGEQEGAPAYDLAEEPEQGSLF